MVYNRGRGGLGALFLLPNMWFFLPLIIGFRGLFKVNFAEDIHLPQT